MIDGLKWIAVDWGSSNLRVWAMGAGGVVLERARSDQGAALLTDDMFEPALLALIGPWLPAQGQVPVLACGMVGARQGWLEAPYIAVPCAPPGFAQAMRVPTRDPRLDIRILPGVSQSAPADVMRGEETQVAGFLALQPDYDGVICLPGTHSKWVHVSAGEIVSFRSFMTGELFDLLAGQTALSAAVTGEGWDDAAFDAAVTDAMGAPQRFAARLFSLRAQSLLQGTAAATQRARLSGLLLGLELAGAREYWLGQSVALVGAPDLTALYRAALSAQGVAIYETDGAAIVLAGLGSIWKEADV